MSTVTSVLITLLLLPVILEFGLTFAAVVPDVEAGVIPDDCKASALEVERGFYPFNGQEMPLYHPWGTGKYSTRRCFLSRGRPRKLVSCQESCRSDDAYTVFAACKGKCSDYYKCFVIESTSSDAPSPRFCAIRFPDSFSLSPEPPLSKNVTSSPTVKYSEGVRNGTNVDVTESVQDNSNKPVIWGSSVGAICVVGILLAGIIYKYRIRKNYNPISTRADPENPNGSVALSQVRPGNGPDNPEDNIEGNPEADPEGNPEGNPEDIGESNPEDNPADTPEDNPADTPEANPAYPPEHVPADPPEHVPDDVAEFPGEDRAAAADPEDGMNTITVFQEITNTPGTQVTSKLEPLTPAPVENNTATSSGEHDFLL